MCFSKALRTRSKNEDSRSKMRKVRSQGRIKSDGVDVPTASELSEGTGLSFITYLNNITGVQHNSDRR